MRLLFFILINTLLFCSCGGAADEAEPLQPEKALLSLPLKDEPCTSGIIVSDTESRVVLKWLPSANTSSYKVTIKNLAKSSIAEYTSDQPELEVKLFRNTPYSWFVTSISSATPATAQSETWKFYNAGPGQISYAPYPAEIISPLMAQQLNTGTTTVKLEWKGADVNNDITGYDVFFGGSDPVLIKSNVSDPFVNGVAVTGQTTYYWKVVTKDAAGNTSDSGLFQFYVN